MKPFNKETYQGPQSKAQPVKPARLIATFILSLILVIHTMGPMVRPAAAASKTVEFAAKVIDFLPPGTFPISGQDLRHSEAFFNCLKTVSGNDAQQKALNCAQNFHDTPIGQKISDEGGLSSTFWDAIEIYLLALDEDWWGLIEKVGITAVCIGAQVLAGGLPVCSILAELIEFFEDAYAFAADVADWLANAWEDAKDWIGSIGAGDMSPTRYYQIYWEPYVAYGTWLWLVPPQQPDGQAVLHKTMGDLWHPCENYYENFLGGGAGNAKCDPMRDDLFKPTVLRIAANMQTLVQSYQKQANLFGRTASLQWLTGAWYPPGSHVSTGASSLAVKKLGINPLYLACTGEVMAVLSKSLPQPGNALNLQYSREIAALQCSRAMAYVKPAAESNWSRDQKKLAHLKAEGCRPPSANPHALNCPRYGLYDECSVLFTTRFAAEFCRVDVTRADKSWADQFAQLRGRNKQGNAYCRASAAGSSSSLACSRPTLKKWCQVDLGELRQRYAKVNGGSTVRCDKGIDPVYESKLGELTDFIARFKAVNAGRNARILQAPYDPMHVKYSIAGNQNDVKLLNEAARLIKPPPGQLATPVKGIGCLPFDGFRFPGYDQPTVCTPVSPIRMPIPKVVFKGPGGPRINPADSMQIESLKSPANARATAKTAPVVSGRVQGPRFAAGVAAPQAKTRQGSAPAGLQIKGHQLKGPQIKGPTFAGGIPGTVARKQTRRGAGPKPIGNAVRNIMGKSGIVSPASITIGRQRAKWGSTLRVSAKQARRRNGYCEFTVSYATRNRGGAAAAFDRHWTNTSVKGNWIFHTARIPAKGRAGQKDRLPLRSGRNELQLFFAPPGRARAVADTVKTPYRLIVDVIGGCGAAAKYRLPAGVKPMSPSKR